MDDWITAVDDWCGWLRLRALSERTIRLRRFHVDFVGRHSGASGPADLTGEQLRVLVDAHPGWSIEYRRSFRASLVSFARYRHQEGFPFCAVETVLPPTRPPVACPRPVTDAIWRDLLAAVRGDDRLELMVRLAGEAGLRRAEVAAVHVDDVGADGGGATLIVRGKGGRQRVVPISDGLAALLVRMAAGGFAFPGRVGGHVSPEWVGCRVSALMPDGWSMHKLRHRFATRGFAGTGNLRAVQEALGHASVATTQRYTAVSSRDVRAVAVAACQREGVADGGCAGAIGGAGHSDRFVTVT